MNTHNSYDLAQMQQLSLDNKIRMTKRRIIDWYEHYNGNVYVSFSGGKDSTVLKHIVDSIYNDVPAVFVNTGLEYPEIQKFVRNVKAGEYDCFNTDVEILRPEMRFDEVIKTYGYPVVSKEVSSKIYDGRRATKNGNSNNYATRQFEGTYISKNGKTNAYSVKKWKVLYDSDILVSHKCCDIMKKNPSKVYEKETGRKPFIGTMASESKLRRSNWLKYGCNAFDKERPTSQPLSFWTENDVLEYIVKYNVPYATVYGDIIKTGFLIPTVNGVTSEYKTTGCSRTGCMFCMFGCHLEDEEHSRFLLMKKTHPKIYDYCMKPVDDGGLGLKDVIDWVNENCNTDIKY